VALELPDGDSGGGGGGGGGAQHRVYLTTKDYSDAEVKCLIACLRPKHAEQVRGLFAQVSVACGGDGCGSSCLLAFGKQHTRQVSLEITLGWDSPFELSVEGGKGVVHISGT
jgi:hypothetical protein